MNSNKYPISRQDNLVMQETDGEILVYDSNTNKALCLNETSAFVWQMCNGGNSHADIKRELSKKFNTPATEDMVWLTLDQLKKENLIVNEITAPSSFSGMNRRDVIKKIGLGSMIALPFISGLLAPKAANAASVVINGATASCPGTGLQGPGAACTSNADCGVDGQNNGQCCRLAAFAGPNRTCITTSNSGGQCAC